MEYEKIIFSRSRSNEQYIKKIDLVKILTSEPYNQILCDLNLQVVKSDLMTELYDKAEAYNKFIISNEFVKPIEHGYNVKSGVKNGDQISSMFHVNERFEFLEDFAKMVLNDEATSLVVSGEGGLGKTYTIKKMIKECRLDESQYKIFKGYCTPFSLYKLLYDHNGKTIIFDDSDSVLDEKTSKELLKNALDSYETRTLSWASKAAEKDDYPTDFEFCGSIIFISNKSKDKIFQPLLSRSYVVDLSMTIDEMLERMEFVASSFASDNNYSYKSVIKAIGFLKENKHYCKNISMRSLIDIVRIYESGSPKWERMALYTLMNE